MEQWQRYSDLTILCPQVKGMAAFYSWMFMEDRAKRNQAVKGLWEETGFGAQWGWGREWGARNQVDSLPGPGRSCTCGAIP